MGKKNKSKSLKKKMKSVLPDNTILFAALGGVAAGITLASIVGADKAKQMVEAVEGSVNQFTDRVKHGLRDKRTATHEEATSNGLKKELV
jgi:hypothetical protein